MLKKKHDVTLVDVRDRDCFERFRIPRSIHVPLYAVKTKGFLKERFLVLVHEGYPEGPVDSKNLPCPLFSGDGVFLPSTRRLDMSWPSVEVSGGIH
jgi:hypothetical protein